MNAWLERENAETRRIITEVITQYDDARLTLADAKHKIAVVIESTMTRVYDKAFVEGVNAAELDHDSDEMEIEFDDEDEDIDPRDVGPFTGHD